MRICVLGNDDSRMSFFGDQPVHLLSPGDSTEILQGDILFDLREEAWDLDRYRQYQGPVFLAAVIGTLAGHEAPANLVRINAWPGMLHKPAWEAVASPGIRHAAETVLATFPKKVLWVDDLVGMVSPRVIAMLVNEATMAEEETVSSREDIDTAMKLGTNYPFGPFEWANHIGWERIKLLQRELAKESNVYAPSKSLAS